MHSYGFFIYQLMIMQGDLPASTFSRAETLSLFVIPTFVVPIVLAPAPIKVEVVVEMLMVLTIIT